MSTVSIDAYERISVDLDLLSDEDLLAVECLIAEQRCTRRITESALPAWVLDK